MIADDVDLVHVVKSRLDGSQLMSHLTSCFSRHQKTLQGAENEVSHLMAGVKENAIALRDASALFRAKAKVVEVTIALRACDREIRAQQAELRDLDARINNSRRAARERLR